MKNIGIREIKSRSDLKEFINFPAQLHHDHPNWVPPIYQDEWSYFDRKKNRAFEYCDTTTALATIDGEVAGRIMGIINHRYNDTQKISEARFSFFDCVNDREVSDRLLRYIEKWASEKGMKKIIGPFGMYYHDPIGYMTDGFEIRPSLSANYNFEYLIRLIESAGYSSETDLVVYEIPVPETLADIYLQVQKRAEGNQHLKLLKFSSRKQLRNYIYPVLSLMNESYVNIYGYSRLDEQEMQELASHYIPLLDPRFVTVVMYDDDVAGFMIGLPCINEGIIAAGGKLFPFGFLKILAAARRSKQLDLLIGGIKEKYRGLGIDVMMAVYTIETAREYGFTSIDSHLELESNRKVRAEMERMGGKITKRYRVFKKNLV